MSSPEGGALPSQSILGKADAPPIAAVVPTALPEEVGADHATAGPVLATEACQGQSPAVCRRGGLVELLSTVPSSVLPLSLGVLNMGAMWTAAARRGMLPEVLADSGEIVAVAVCIILQASYALKIGAMTFLGQGIAAVLIEYTSNIPQWSAGAMLGMFLAGWLNARGATSVARGLWTLSALQHWVHKVVFLIVLARSASAASSLPGEGYQADAAADARLKTARRTLAACWREAQGGWFVPLVGILTVAITARVVFDAENEFAVIGTVRTMSFVCGVGWYCIMMAPMAVKIWSSGDVWRKPPSVILMAPCPLFLLAWFACSEDYLDEGQSIDQHWLIHALTIGALIFAVPAVCSLPLLLDPRKPFSPAQASCTFPMDSFAMILIKYDVVMEEYSFGAIVHALAWAQLALATITVSVVLARFVQRFLLIALAQRGPS